MARPSIVLRDAIARANKIIYQTAKTQPQCEGMGTTIVACLFFDNRVAIAHVGDSRLYRLRAEPARADDHGPLPAAGAGRPRLLLPGRGPAGHQQELRDPSPRRGAHASRSRSHEQPVDKGDFFCLCSDGLSDMVEDDDIHLTMSTFSASLETVAKQLIHIVERQWRSRQRVDHPCASCGLVRSADGGS